MKPFRSEFLRIRGLRYHIRHWGNDTAPMLFMLHGWMDCSASFQFVVDALQQDWHVVAPDWRGFGLSENTAGDCYWFPDYLGDLDAILQLYSPLKAVNLLGHSMGGNVVALYAGVRPERVDKLINLEGFGLPNMEAPLAPGKYAKWLDALREPAELRSYSSREKVAERLQKTNPRLSDERAAFLSGHWARENARGEWEILGDPAHKLPNPVLYREAEVLACWAETTAPVLWVEAEHTVMWNWMGGKEKGRAAIEHRLQAIPNVKPALLRDAGHMLHHDQPEELAHLIEAFLMNR